MSGFEPIDDAPSGALVALPIAEAHLSANLNAINAIDGRAMFLVGANIAGFGIFVGAVVALAWGLECVIAPAVLFIVAIGLGLWTLWRRETAQFPSAEASMELLLQADVNDDQLAWIYLRAVAEASADVDAILARKATLTLWLFFTTIGHLGATVLSVVICGS